jgi:hypothetical protein
MRCTNEYCKNRCFYTARADTKAAVSSRLISRDHRGWQDWSSVAGSVLRNSCYLHFKNKGTLCRNATYHGGESRKPASEWLVWSLDRPFELWDDQAPSSAAIKSLARSDVRGIWIYAAQRTTKLAQTLDETILLWSVRL